MAAYITASEYFLGGVPLVALESVTTEEVEDAIAKASSHANAHIRAWYALPLTAWGDDLKEAVTDIVSWRLLRHRGFNPEDKANNAVVMAWKAAEMFLDQVAEGVTSLDPEVTFPAKKQGPDVATIQPAEIP